jgi:hypothetical protein
MIRPADARHISRIQTLDIEAQLRAQANQPIRSFL